MIRLCLFAAIAWGAGWTLETALLENTNGTDDIMGIAHFTDAGDYWFVGENADYDGSHTDPDTDTAMELYIRRWDPVNLFAGNKVLISNELVAETGVHYLSSMDSEAASGWLYVSPRKFSTGCGGGQVALVEELKVNRANDNVSATRDMDPDNTCVEHKHHHLQLDEADGGLIGGAWTVSPNSDDAYYNERSGANWSSSERLLAQEGVIQDHATIAFRTDGTRVIAYHDDDADDIRVELEVSGVGNTTLTLDNSDEMDWPHVIEGLDGILYIVAHKKLNGGANYQLSLASCPGANGDCDTVSDWTGELIGANNLNAKHPQIAVDESSRIFIAHDIGLGNFTRAEVSFKCTSMGGWTHELVDDLTSYEGIGGLLTGKVYPAIQIDTSTDPEQLSVTYARYNNGAADTVRGRWGRKDLTGMDGFCP